MKIKIYLGIIVLLVGFLIYAICFMKSDYEDPNALPPTIHKKKITVGDTHIEEYIPDYLPKPIPADVLKGAEENDFYYYLFLNPNKKSVFYQYRAGSTSPADSEEFHKEITKYIQEVRNDGNYKNKFVLDTGVEIYERNLLNASKVATYVPQKGDSKWLIEKMEKLQARIEAVKDFRKECAKTFCIINNKTKEYVILDERDLTKAKKLLDDYKMW